MTEASPLFDFRVTSLDGLRAGVYINGRYFKECSLPLQEEWLYQAIGCAVEAAGLDRNNVLCREVVGPLPLHRRASPSSPKRKAPVSTAELTLADLGL